MLTFIRFSKHFFFYKDKYVELETSKSLRGHKIEYTFSLNVTNDLSLRNIKFHICI